jgi:oligo-1,6-glucosidase
MSKWQTALDGKAWNSLYWNNHDQPRVVSRFGDDRPEYRVRSAKMLGAVLHFMQGTPYIYQGEELGMTNVAFPEISQYRDIETLNAYHELVDSGRVTPQAMMAAIHHSSRDNARTPMQWDATANAGFTSGTPWLAVNPNYQEINAQAAQADPDSVWHFYQQMNALRKQYPVITYGHYQLLDPEAEHTWCYARTLDDERLIVAANFTATPQPVPAAAQTSDRQLLGNYPATQAQTLRPYEVRVLFNA